MEERRDIKTNNAEQNEHYIFKKILHNNDGTLPENPIKPFEALLQNKPVGTWLVRESSSREGMLTISWNRYEETKRNEIKNTRLATTDNNGWVELDDETTRQYLEQHPEYQGVTSIDASWDNLQKFLITLGFKPENVIQPTKEQGKSYVSYMTIHDGNSKKIFNNPIPILENISKILKKAGNELGLNPKELVGIPFNYTCFDGNDGFFLKLAEKAEKYLKYDVELKELFSQWLKQNNLHEEYRRCCCPIGLDIFVDPHVVSPSYQVFEGTNLYYSDTPNSTKLLPLCPMTRQKISSVKKLEGYSAAFNHCLKVFINLAIAYYQKKNLEQQTFGEENSVIIEETKDSSTNEGNLPTIIATITGARSSLFSPVTKEQECNEKNFEQVEQENQSFKNPLGKSQ